MKHRRTVFCGCLVAAILIVTVLWARSHANTPEQKTRRLLQESREEGPGMLRQLLTRLRLAEPANRREPMEIVNDLAALGEPAVPILIEALDDPPCDATHVPFEALVGIGRPAVPYLIRAARQNTGQVQQDCIMAFYNMGPEAEEAVDVLIWALHSEDPSTRSTAAMALGAIGPPARRAIPALRPLLRDDIGWARNEAEIAIEKLRPPLTD